MYACVCEKNDSIVDGRANESAVPLNGANEAGNSKSVEYVIRLVFVCFLCETDSFSDCT